MKKEFWNAEKLLGLSALLVSLFTLMVFIYQTNLIRKQQYMSVYPHLNIGNKYSGSLEYQYVLSNDGIGPAMIKSVEVSLKNGEKFESLNHYVRSALTKADTIYYFTSDIAEGMLIPAQSEIALFGLYDKEKTTLRNQAANTVAGAIKLRSILNSENLIIKIVYESIYEERWEINRQSAAPIKHE